MLTWAYHKENEPIIIDEEEFESYESKGWADSPLYFITISDHGIDADDPTAVQNFAEAITGVRDSMNAALNIDEMDKDDFIEYASTHHGCELEYHRREATLRSQVYALAYGE